LADLDGDAPISGKPEIGGKRGNGKDDAGNALSAGKSPLTIAVNLI
jgi:hypothetical protein